jgi:sentrin-specific protease 1
MPPGDGGPRAREKRSILNVKAGGEGTRPTKKSRRSMPVGASAELFEPNVHPFRSTLGAKLRASRSDLMSLGAGGSRVAEAQRNAARSIGLPATKMSSFRCSAHPVKRPARAQPPVLVPRRDEGSSRRPGGINVRRENVAPTEVIDLEAAGAMATPPQRAQSLREDDSRLVSDDDDSDVDVVPVPRIEQDRPPTISERMRARKMPVQTGVSLARIRSEVQTSRISDRARNSPPRLPQSKGLSKESRPRPLTDVKNTKGVAVTVAAKRSAAPSSKPSESAKTIPASNFYGKDDVSPSRALLGRDTASRKAPPVGDRSVRMPAKASPVSVLEKPRFVPNKRLRPLDELERKVFQTTTQKVVKGEIVAEVKSANIVLRGKDIVRLRGRRWLNDEVVNAMVGLINDRNRAFFANAASASASSGGKAMGAENDDDDCQVVDTDVVRPGRPRCYMFNSFFFTRLHSNGYDYDGVERWPTRAKIDVLSQDLILLPVNLNNFHWVLAAVDLRHRAFLYLDSMYGADTFDVLPTLRRWLFDEVANKHGEGKAESLKIDSWTDVQRPSYLPRQGDDGSCGVFTLYMADYLELGKTPDFGQHDIVILRQRAVLFLKDGALPAT